MDAKAIIELSKQLKPEDSMITPRKVPEAVEWFAEISSEVQKQYEKQEQLRNMMLRNGWEIPPCLYHLQRLCLYPNVRLEAYRIIAGFYSWIGASSAHIWYEVKNCDQRNPINDFQKLKAIISFAVENPGFFGCEHPLLKQFCPAGKCFMAELINEYDNPCLFEQV
ncbi:MAG: hypothetical protein JRJ14_05200 [Deltaproteobacteria bacterium]|nr:hypothetical protein [Deltaproteobacteria bacterium]